MPTRSTSLLSAILVFPAAVAAQTLPVGTWNGTLTLGGAPISVMFTVNPDQSQHDATMRTADGPETPVSDLVVTDDGIEFTWGAFRCSMSHGDGAYRGDCRTSDGSTGQLTLAAPPSDASVRETPKGSDILTGQELMASGASDLYDAVRRLRPRWLERPRGGGKSFTVGGVAVVTNDVTIFLGRQALGPAEALRQYTPEHVAQLRYFGPRDAIVEFGSRNQGGVIQITQRR